MQQRRGEGMIVCVVVDAEEDYLLLSYSRISRGNVTYFHYIACAAISWCTAVSPSKESVLSSGEFAKSTQISNAI